MHPSVIDFLRKEIKGSDILGKTVLEVGSYNVNGTPRSVIEPLAPASYIGVDAQGGPGVDKVVAADDLVKEFGEERFDVVVSTEMLEHVRYWRRIVAQMKAVTKIGGLLIVTTRSPGFPYHAYPEDHWRFTVVHFQAIFADMEILALDLDIPNMPGVLLKARRKVGHLLTVEELGPITPGNSR
jgi:SAM-dependent methyltransferase